MVCDKCGTEVTKSNQFCPKCGVEIKKQEKKRNGIIKPVIIIGLILVIIIVCVVMKYYAIIPLSGLAILCVTVLINRKILKMRKHKKEKVEEYNLSDAEMKKFSEYFVSRDEKYLSSLGNGYIMNFFANGSLKRGFAVISDRRVYFRGSCFSGQGKNLKKTDEERTVDIKDVTGSGFIYRRYWGVLLGLLTALVVLIQGILGSAAGALWSFRETVYYQREEEEAAENYHSVQKADDRVKEIEEEIKELEDKRANLQSDLDEKVALQQEERKAKATENKWFSEYLYDTEINVAYGEYLNQLNSIFKKSHTYFLLDGLKDGANYSLGYRTVNEQMVLDEVDIDEIGCLDGNSLLEYYNMSNSLYISPMFFCMEIYGYSTTALQWAENCDLVMLTFDDMGVESFSHVINSGWLWDASDLGISYVSAADYDCSAVLTMEMGDAFDQAYKDFINTIAPEYAEKENYTLEEVVLSYLQNNPNATLEGKVDLSGISTKYDEDVQKITADLSAIDTKIAELMDEKVTVSNISRDIDRYEDEYNSCKQETFGHYMLTTVAVAGAGLLVTFFISCIAVFVDYLSKRKTLFEIQYAGGRIAFDVSFYAKAEIDDFQKQLRRAKDFAQETATVRTVTVEAPAQTPTQNNVPDDLRKYADLLKEGLISQEEYDAMKKKILGL